MSFDVASELKAEIARENDKDRRTVFMLLLGVLEANTEGMNKLSRKIDDLRSDEQSLRTAVLNGHEARHHLHHDWIEERMAKSCDEACDWAEKKRLAEIEDEKQDKENAKADKRTARDAAIRQFVTVMVSIALGGVAALLALNNLSVTLK